MYILLFVYSYLILGFYLSFILNEVDSVYLLLLLFITFKVVTNYRVCSFAYLECKVRDVRREESYINQFLDPIVNLRYTDHIYILFPLTFIILFYNIIYRKDNFNLLNVFKKD